MGVKRATARLPEDVVERARSLCAGGRSLREIETLMRAEGTKVGKSALAEACKGLRAEKALAEDDAAAADDFGATRDLVLRAVRRQATLIGRLKEPDPKSLVALTKAMDSAAKLERLYRGKATAHTKTESGAPAGDSLTDEERELLEAAKLTGEAQ